jgi:hypothetical protein
MPSGRGNAAPPGCPIASLISRPPCSRRPGRGQTPPSARLGQQRRAPSVLAPTPGTDKEATSNQTLRSVAGGMTALTGCPVRKEPSCRVRHPDQGSWSAPGGQPVPSTPSHQAAEIIYARPGPAPETCFADNRFGIESRPASARRSLALAREVPTTHRRRDLDHDRPEQTIQGRQHVRDFLIWMGLHEARMSCAWAGRPWGATASLRRSTTGVWMATSRQPHQ